MYETYFDHLQNCLIHVFVFLRPEPLLLYLKLKNLVITAGFF